MLCRVFSDPVGGHLAASGMPRPLGRSQDTSSCGTEEGEVEPRLAQRPAGGGGGGTGGREGLQREGRWAEEAGIGEKEEAASLAEGTRALPATPWLFGDEVANDRLWLEARGSLTEAGSGSPGPSPFFDPFLGEAFPGSGLADVGGGRGGGTQSGLHVGLGKIGVHSRVCLRSSAGRFQEEEESCEWTVCIVNMCSQGRVSLCLCVCVCV